MAQVDADRNLLFGILAVQMDFISRDSLIGAMNAWVLEKEKPLGQILLDQRAVSEEEYVLLNAMVAKHVEKHDNDVERSLAAVRTLGTVPTQLESIADADLHASLARAGAVPPHDGLAEATHDFTASSTASSARRFRILRPHAKGGLGQVWVAFDKELHREVALKEIQPQHAHDVDSRSRFVLEAEITGGLEHPGIVPVYGLGHYEDGRPYYAMRFIKGSSLKEAIDHFHHASGPGLDPGHRTLALRKLLGRFLDVCNAIAYAHSRGVLHRDLKPGNVMLGQYGETLVVDWGLAKSMERAEEVGRSQELTLRPASSSGSAPTQVGLAMGTPQYMSPEQAAGRLERLGPPSDVYSLGATLYCLLTGKPPFDDQDVGKLLRDVQQGAFKPPRQLSRQVPPALEAICLKAMALEPTNRYASPRALAEDIEHWLADEPVAARADPLLSRLARWSRRHRPVVAGVAVLLVSAVAALAISTIMIGREQLQTDQQRRHALSNLAEANRQHAFAAQKSREATEKAFALERQLYINRMNLAQRETVENVALAEQLLDLCPPALQGWEWRYLRRLCHLDLITLIHGVRVSSVAFSPDGLRIVSGGGPRFNSAKASHDAELKLWDAATGRELLSFQGLRGAVRSVAFSPDGRRVVSGSGYYEPDREGYLTLWDATTGAMIFNKKDPHLNVLSVEFSPDGQSIAAGYGSYSSTLVGYCKIWDANTGAEMFTIPGSAGGINSLAYRPNGRQIALAGSGTVDLWNLSPVEKVREFRGHSNWIYGVAFSPDGRRLATVGWDNTLKLWDPDHDTVILSIEAHLSAIDHVAFSPDSQRIATAGDKSIKLWDATTGRRLVSLHGHRRGVTSVVFSPDGKRLASGGADKSVKVWDATTDREVTFREHTGWVTSVAFSPDSKRVATASGDASLKLWDPATGAAIKTMAGNEGWVLSVAFMPNGRLLATGDENGSVRIWDATKGELLHTMKGHQGAARVVAVSPDGATVASAGNDRTVRLWDVASARELHTLKPEAGVIVGLAFSPDGKRLAMAGGDGTVRIWDLSAIREILSFAGHAKSVYSVAFSPDGTRIASAGVDLSVKIWDAATGRVLHTLQGHTEGLNSVVFSPDGKRLASSSYDTSIKIWDAVTGDEILTLRGHKAGVVCLAFSPDGQRLASGSVDWTARIWDAAPVPPERLIPYDDSAEEL